MAKINIEFDGKIYSVDETTLAPLASPLEQALIHQLAGTGAVIRLGGTNYNVDANKLASARNVLTNHLGSVAGTDSKVVVAGAEYGLSKTKLQNATDKMTETLGELFPPLASEGLEFGFNGSGYSVSGLGTCTDTDIVIPSTYRGLPVNSVNISGYGDERIDKICSVVIPDSVTHIAGFNSWPNLVNIKIGNKVDYIGMDAFENTGYYNDNTNWENGVLYLNNCLIAARDELDTVNIKAGTRTIIQNAFYNCSNLASVSMPEGVINIGPESFAYTAYYDNEANWENGALYINTYLIAVKTEVAGEYSVKPGTTVIASGAFAGHMIMGSYEGNYNLISVIIPNSVVSINPYAFQSCGSLTSVNIPDSVMSIGHHAFEDCYSLISIIIPDNVKSIGDLAFYGCSNLTSITIGKGVTNLSGFSFSDYTILKEINVSEDNTAYTSIDGILYTKDGKILIACPMGKEETNITIPNGVTSIDYSAFKGCSNLASITIPNSVTNIGDYAFSNCSNLTSITIPNSVTSIGEYAFFNSFALKNIYIDQLEEQSQLKPATWLIDEEFYEDEGGEWHSRPILLIEKVTIHWN